jgi:hypothetical protein
MGPEQSFCLFQGDGGPMAVSVASVAAVLETRALVPLVWSPPQLVGLCPHHREVVPVVSLAPDPRTERGEPARRPHGPAVAGRGEPSGAGPDAATRCAVLILKTEHDVWGLRIHRRGTSIALSCPIDQSPQTDEHGAVWIGTLREGDARYAILDAEATWRSLRLAVARWYGLMSEGKHDAPVPDECGESR